MGTSLFYLLPTYYSTYFFLPNRLYVHKKTATTTMEKQDRTVGECDIIRREKEFLEECSKKGEQDQQGREEVVGEDAEVVMKYERSAGIGEARRLEIAERIKLANKRRGGDFASHFEDKDGKVR